MIDLQDLRSRPEAYQKACDKKRIKLDISAFLRIDEERRTKVTEVETLRASQKSMSKEVPSLKGDEGTKKREELKILSSRVKELENNLDETLKEWNRLQLLIPSIPVDEVPDGKDDSENVEFKRVGEIPQFSFKPKDHVEIGEALKLFDVERGVKLAGSRSYFLTGMGARLQHAVLSLALDFIAEKGYTIMEPPHIVNYKAMMGTGYFPGGEDMAYHLDERDDESYLIGTSEVPVAAYHLDETLNHAELPKRYSGYSPCYRREAGTYGKDTRGLYRVHQFYKVEQVVICENNEETSRALHNELLGNAEQLLTLLELPYRVVVVCTGDMGQGQVWKHDIETWMPSRNAYSETHSCSTLHDFQARRLNLKYRDQSGKSVYCHTLNNTLIASPRVLIPLIENHQLEDGSIRVPKALQKYLGGLTKIG
jgi:seryl-tRNA synthetase